MRHPNRVRSVRFTKDGQRVVTDCDDRTVRIWALLKAGQTPAQLSFSGLESLTGLRLNQQTGIEVLDTPTWTQLRRDYPVSQPAGP
jgi:WD40 repeat protein